MVAAMRDLVPPDEKETVLKMALKGFMLSDKQNSNLCTGTDKTESLDDFISQTLVSLKLIQNDQVHKILDYLREEDVEKKPLTLKLHQ